MSGSPFPTRDSELQAFAAVSTGRREKGEGGGEGRGEGCVRGFVLLTDLTDQGQTLGGTGSFGGVRDAVR